PEEVASAVRSARAQLDVDIELIVVGNGVEIDEELDADVRISLPANVGIPEGRNRGAAVASAPLLCFLDDDGELLDAGSVAEIVRSFATDTDLAVVGLGIVDDDGRRTRRHDPRLRPRAHRTAAVTSFPGGACVIRRQAFRDVGGFAGPFWYALEETDLAWRLLDAGWTIRFDPDLLMRHPRSTPDRHSSATETTARNRAWIAHRSLPALLVPLYLLSWMAITLVRDRHSWSLVRAHFRGTIAGLRAPLGPRKPISWRTVWRMTRLGRPPVF
ncbi:MAG: glycosyltransferase, partial [Actinomycetota bacterium]